MRAGSTAISLVEGKDPVMRGTNLHELRLAFIFCHEPYVFANIKIYMVTTYHFNFFSLYFETAALTYRLILFSSFSPPAPPIGSRMTAGGGGGGHYFPHFFSFLFRESVCWARTKQGGGE